MDPATTEIYTYLHTLSLHDALPIFVRGLVDSDDLTLNVSRELLQSSRQVERIRGALTKRVLDLLERIAGEDNEKYGVFWQAFGNVLKEGVVEDTGNRERILKLLRFPSTLRKTADDRVWLDAYLPRKTGRSSCRERACQHVSITVATEE